MTTSTLKQLLAEAQEAKDNPEELQRQMEELTTKWFGVSGVYEENRDELSRLVRLLEELLPSIVDYEAYAAPHDGKIAGPQWNTERIYTDAAKRLRIKNPGLVMRTQCDRDLAEKGEVFPELSDDEYEVFLDDVELMANWWEKKASATPLELAKSVVVHVVMKSPELRDRVLQEAEREVDRLVKLDAKLGRWREEL